MSMLPRPVWSGLLTTSLPSLLLLTVLQPHRRSPRARSASGLCTQSSHPECCSAPRQMACSLNSSGFCLNTAFSVMLFSLKMSIWPPCISLDPLFNFLFYILYCLLISFIFCLPGSSYFTRMIDSWGQGFFQFSSLLYLQDLEQMTLNKN